MSSTAEIELLDGIDGAQQRRDAEGLPDAFAPLIRNAWYVIAAAKDVNRELKSITVIGDPLVMYRTEAGEPVVLDNRCPHRRFSLSKGVLDGDNVRCGYHGFTFSPSGACVYVPEMGTAPRFGVRRYPAVERGGWLWAWMGDAERADPAEIPLPADFEQGEWHTVGGYTPNPSNYMLLFENLIDLRHVHFLHGEQALDRAAAEVPPKNGNPPKNGIEWVKVEPHTALAITADWVGGNPQQVVHQVETLTAYGPSLVVGRQDRTPLPGDPTPLPEHVRVTHALTPQDMYNTHQFWQMSLSSPFAIPPETLRDFIGNVVYTQDQVVLAEVQKTILADQRSGTVEYGSLADRFAVRMRRVLRDMKAAEATS
jgi:vanillate O-demethylase monooxygenase subunit